MAASVSNLRVVKSVQNLDELRSCCLGNTQPLLIPNNKGNFVNFNRRRIQQLRLSVISSSGQAAAASSSSSSSSSSGVVVNNNVNYSSESCSSSITPHLSLFNHQYYSDTSSIVPKKKKRVVVDKEENIDDVSGNLDRWVKDSVVEILKNLDEAPFLIHVYPDGEKSASKSSNTRLVKEKADAESWPLIKGRWGGGGSPSPGGIILVEEMSSEDDAVGEVLGSPGMDYDDSGSSSSSSSSSSSPTKVWGLLIQGKGLSCPACYILKTCRVRCVAGFCTHFCLVRVKCFFETVDMQLQKLWLV